MRVVSWLQTQVYDQKIVGPYEEGLEKGEGTYHVPCTPADTRHH
jgi:hypothetical protein